MVPLSIIVPVLNEAGLIAESLDRLGTLRARGAEVIVVDGGSTDGTPELARSRCDRLIAASAGRACQMNAGAQASGGDILLFLHADCILPADAHRLIADGLRASARCWGRFDITIVGAHPMLPVVAWFMNQRSRLTGIATGDQGIFVRADVFHACGGFPQVPLMEDIRMSKLLKAFSPPLCLGQRITASGRRWEQRGTWRTIILMWRLRLAHYLGADPVELSGLYERPRRT
jgi:rSAM/selenodomain-associated transferase 2